MKLITLIFSAAIVMAALVGCAGTPIDDERGESVAQMIKSQTYDPAASEKSAGVTPLGQDGIGAQSRFNSIVRGTETTEASKRTMKSRIFRTDVAK